jgi:hypothetical protein
MRELISRLEGSQFKNKMFYQINASIYIYICMFCEYVQCKDMWKHPTAKKESYLHFTLPQSLLTARKEWSNGGGSSLEKALAMAAFGQMMKTGASINGWWGSHQQSGRFGGGHHHIVFFRTHRHNPSENDDINELLVAASPALLLLEQEYKKLISVKKN